MLLRHSLITATALLGFTSPAVAQDGPFPCYLGSHGTEPFYDVKGWIGGERGAWDVATASGYLDISEQVPANMIHVYYMSVSAAVDVRLEVANRDADTNALAYISEGADGWRKVHAEDDGRFTGGRDEKLLGAGQYCLYIEAGQGRAADALVRLGRQEHTPLTTAIPDDMRELTDCEQAPLFGDVGTTRMITARETPLVRFEMTAENRVTIVADSDAAQPHINLHNIDDLQIWGGDEHRLGGYERIVPGYAMIAGTYCVSVEADKPDVPFPLTIAVYHPAEIAANEYNHGREAPPLDSGHPIIDFGDRTTMTVDVGRNVSWLVFTQDEAAPVIIQATAPDFPDAGIPMKLFDLQGNQVSQGFGAVEEYYYADTNRYSAQLLPGTYRLGIGHFEVGQVVPINVTIAQP